MKRPIFCYPFGMEKRSTTRFMVILGLALLVALAAAALHAQGMVGKRVRGFPSPGDKPEGLAWDGQFLWCNNFNGGSLHKLDPSDGSVIAHYQGVGLPGNPEGLAWDGQHLWTCDWHSGIIFKILPTPQGIQLVATYLKPEPSGPNVGLEWDGTSLWLSCWPDVSKGLGFGQLFRLHPATLAVQQEHILPVHFIEDLAWDGHYLWSCDWLNGIGFAIDPATGDTLHTYRTPGPNPVGSAWDGTSLWITDTDRDSIWALDIGGTTPATASSWSQVKRLFRGR